MGRQGFNFAALVNSRDSRIGVELYIGGSKAKQRFKLLHNQKKQIEAEFGNPLDWRELRTKIATRVLFLRENTDMKNRDAWPEQHAWLASHLEKLVRVLKTRILAISDGNGDGIRD